MPRVHTLSRRAKLSDAAAKRKDLDILHRVVVDAAGRVCGVLSDRDVKAARAESSAEAAAIRVEDVMAHNPVTVHATDRVVDALEKMR